jgi:nucleotide-binding universal stress UspA family protein
VRFSAFRGGREFYDLRVAQKQPDTIMKKILVPTDLSDTAELGLKLATEIAKRCHATISLINFTQHPLGKTFSSTGEINLGADETETAFNFELLKTRKEKLETLASNYAREGVTISFAIIDDKFKDGIDTYLRGEEIDLIVMGTSGEETPKEAFTGNHTEQVIKISTCPVLSVRDGFKASDFKNIVAAVNVITDNQIAHGLSTLKDVALCFDSQVHLVHVRDKAKDSNLLLHEYFTKMAEIAELPKFNVVVLEESQDPAEAIIEYSRQIRAGLLAVIKNSKDGIFRIFSNKFSNRLVKEEGRPVFTYNLQNAEVG